MIRSAPGAHGALASQSIGSKAHVIGAVHVGPVDPGVGARRSPGGSQRSGRDRSRTMRAVSSRTTWTMRGSASSFSASVVACAEGITLREGGESAPRPWRQPSEQPPGRRHSGWIRALNDERRQVVARVESQGGPRRREVRGSPGRLEPAPGREVRRLVEIQGEARVPWRMNRRPRSRASSSNFGSEASPKWREKSSGGLR